MQNDSVPNIIIELQGGFRLGISVTELKKHMGRIIDFIDEREKEIFITKNGKVVAKLIPLNWDPQKEM